MKKLTLALAISAYPLSWASYWHGINDLDDLFMCIISLIAYCLLILYMLGYSTSKKGGF